MAEDVLTYLQSKGLQLKPAGGREVHTLCPYCHEDEGKRGRLYVNVDAFTDVVGLHYCHLCGAKGNLVTLQKFFGDYQKPLDEDDSYVRMQILAAACDWYHERLGEHEDAYRWLRGSKRGLEAETIIKYRLGYAPVTAGNQLYRALKDLGFKTTDILGTGLVSRDRESERLFDTLSGMVTIPYFVAGNCVSIRGRAWPERADKPKYRTPPGVVTRLYNSEAVWGEDEVCVAEGELDALVLEQFGFKAVACPGANVWQSNWKDYFTGLRRAWILFDPDEAGEKGASRLIEEVGPRARRVHLPSDVTEWILEGHDASELREIMAEAGRSRFLVSVHEAAAEFRRVQSQSGLRLGYGYLDHYMAPGLHPHQIAVLIAKSGVGKTVMLLNFMQRAVMVDGQSDLRFLFVSLEQTGGEWFDRARRLYGFYNPNSTDQQAEQFWAARLHLIEKNRLSEDELLASLDDFEYEMGGKPDLVLVDYLGYWAQGFKGDRYERTSDAIMSIKAIAKDRRVPFIVPQQVNRSSRYGEEPDIDTIRDAGTVLETTDFLFSFWTEDDRHGLAEPEKNGRYFLRMGKSRHGNRGAKVGFQFDPLYLAHVPTDESLWLRKAVEDMEEHRQGGTYEQRREVHRRAAALSWNGR
jgi:hypothetical protein